MDMPDLFSAVNKKVTDITNCEEEPIHIPGSIQPHGFLLVCSKENGHVLLCSANIEQFLKLSPQQLLLKPAKQVLPEALYTLLESPEDFTHENLTPVTIHVHNNTFDCFRRASKAYIFLECIITTDHMQGVYELFTKTNNLLKATDRKTTLQKLCSLVTENIRQIISFDRVMIYRFDADYNGHVYAESREEGIESFLGLHYPHTDIPKQARDLYLKNLVRLIPDVAYTPVPIVTMEAALAKPDMIDLSDVQLRSVSPIHIQYLKNMGVGASMSISLIKDGKLWGLIACHHGTAKPLSFVRQVQAYLLAQVLGSQIAVQETAEEYRLAQQVDIPLKILMNYLKRTENFIELHYGKLEEIKTMVNASGAALVYKNKIYTNGLVPPDAFIFSLQHWLQNDPDGHFNTAELGRSFSAATAFAGMASGLLYQQLSKETGIDLFWFRQSAEKVISWAGNPYTTEERSVLTPRNSFAAWKEIKQGISETWKQPELDAAFRFSYLLQQHISHINQREEEVKSRKLNERLVKANKELENINWISTHDLKEPLRKIQILASMIDRKQEITGVDNMRLSIEKIRSAATRMQQFIDDLLKYSKMSGADMAYENIRLDELLKTILIDLKEEKEQEFFEISSESLPEIFASRFQVQQLFINLIHNAIKFRKENEKQYISIQYEEVTDESISDDEKKHWHKITISDTGIGFTETMANSIFDIFRRGHAEDKFTGTGVGLSICRKIMENHGGKILASGKENEGACFSLYFPVS